MKAYSARFIKSQDKRLAFDNQLLPVLDSFHMKLSIIIPTRNRPAMLLETLATIAPQLSDEVELIIMDASDIHPDEKVLNLKLPSTKYLRGKAANFDDAYDEAVSAASGEWVWLFSDDDWFKPGAVATVMRHLNEGIDIIIVNAEVRDQRMEQVLKPRWVVMPSRDYATSDFDQLFADLGDLGTFLGSMLIRRTIWAERLKEAEPYRGKRFLTFVIPFLRPTRARFLQEVLVAARFGHQGWIGTSAQLVGEIMTEVVWSLPVADWAKARVRPRRASLGELLLWRAIGCDVSAHSRLVAQVPRYAAKAVIKLGLRLTGRSGGLSDYMLSLCR